MDYGHLDMTFSFLILEIIQDLGLHYLCLRHAMSADSNRCAMLVGLG